MRGLSSWLGVWLLIGSSGAVQGAETMQARSDHYTVEWSGISLGEGTISLEKAEGENCYRYSSTTNPVAVVRWTYGSPAEHSTFCIQDGQLRARSFTYTNDKRSKDSFVLDFDWDKKQVHTAYRGQSTTRELPAIAYDRLSIRQAVRLWVLAYLDGKASAEAEFVMVDDDRIKPYRFAIGARENVVVGKQTIEALRVDRIDERRPHHYWLDPARDYVPVKIEQLKDGKVELRMQIKP